MRFAFIKLVLLLLVLPVAGFAQNPTKWSLSLKAYDTETNFKRADRAQPLVITAQLDVEIEDGWRLYALDQPDGGPIATKITVPPDQRFEFSGNIRSVEPKSKADPNFIIDGKPLTTRYYEHSTTFSVDLIPTDKQPSPAEIGLDVRFQVCNDSFCLPPRTKRVFPSGEVDVKKSALSSQPSASSSTTNELRTTNNQQTDLWSFLWLAVTFGAISLLTPCVFPMIPITVSYFMKHADGDRSRTLKLATVYSVGIIATFSALGMLLAVVFGAAGINLFAANPWVNLFIGGLFLFFAFNLFGFYEISVPSSLLTKLDSITRSEEGKGSAYIGALLMGLTFTLTSFTCTSPFIGSLLVSTAQGDWKMPLVGMLAFSFVFALPFFVLAAVPRLLHSLPRSGGWLNSVKVVMGFLEVAAAMKFLSNVDLVWGAGFNETGVLNYGKIFTRELVLIIWIVIGLGIVAYVLGFFRFKHDSPVKKITPLRIIFAGVFLGLCFYLTTGVLGKKLGELESFLPPKNPRSMFNVLGNPHEELAWITNDFEGALAKAKAENRKVFVDFTGYTCTNCRWMEANMFVVPEVKAEMEKFVLVSLYTDGEGEVYERQQQFQQDTFQTVALPFYAVFDSEGKPEATFPGLSRNKEEFIEFLKKAQ
ncbi:MAG TPA: cytochrome c biogenesis protein CcdA [Pyrinomonadaceae bacterium]|nr:cytochrome c biogenesis protein CcdA [Pyrinomonadaceae bacterium]